MISTGQQWREATAAAALAYAGILLAALAYHCGHLPGPGAILSMMNAKTALFAAGSAAMMIFILRTSYYDLIGYINYKIRRTDELVMLDDYTEGPGPRYLIDRKYKPAFFVVLHLGAALAAHAPFQHRPCFPGHAVPPPPTVEELRERAPAP